MKIAEYSGCAALSDLIDKNNLLVLNCILDLAREIQRPPTLHRDLLGIVTGDSADAAVTAMRQHVQMGLDETIRAVALLNSRTDDRWRIRASAKNARTGKR
jgi:DNA-binding GntR family transcriptional regulator